MPLPNLLPAPLPDFLLADFLLAPFFPGKVTGVSFFAPPGGIPVSAVKARTALGNPRFPRSVGEQWPFFSLMIVAWVASSYFNPGYWSELFAGV